MQTDRPRRRSAPAHRDQRLDMSDVQLGDSIAVNGVCLTGVKLRRQQLHRRGVARNAELHRRAGTAGRAGQSGKGAAPRRQAGRASGQRPCGWRGRGAGVYRSWRELEAGVRAPQALAKYIAAKGSITINGVSLTVNQVKARFHVNLIPHTLQKTTLKGLHTGCQGESGNRPDRAICGTDDAGSRK